MSFGPNHIFDMIARMKANKDLLRKRGLFRKKEYFEPSVSSRKIISTPLTEEERFELQQDIAIRNRKNNKATWWSIIIAIIVTILLSYFFVIILNLIFNRG